MELHEKRGKRAQRRTSVHLKNAFVRDLRILTLSLSKTNVLNTLQYLLGLKRSATLFGTNMLPLSSSGSRAEKILRNVANRGSSRTKSLVVVLFTIFIVWLISCLNVSCVYSSACKSLPTNDYLVTISCNPRQTHNNTIETIIS